MYHAYLDPDILGKKEFFFYTLGRCFFPLIGLACAGAGSRPDVGCWLNGSRRFYKTDGLSCWCGRVEFVWYVVLVG